MYVENDNYNSRISISISQSQRDITIVYPRNEGLNEKLSGEK